jgi:hypothetical protein
MRIAAVPIVAAAVVALAGAARAEPTRLDLTPAPKADAAAALNAAVLAPDRQDHELPAPGLARTSIDHRFDRDRASGALGFLCGRPDSLDERARSQPLGSDPQGRFLGGRFSVTF